MVCFDIDNSSTKKKNILNPLAVHIKLGGVYVIFMQDLCDLSKLDGQKHFALFC